MDLEEFVELELLLPLFDVLREEDDEHEADPEPELTDFELLKLFDCCCCCNCWRHLARRFLNQTWKEKKRKFKFSLLGNLKK